MAATKDCPGQLLSSRALEKTRRLTALVYTGSLKNPLHPTLTYVQKRLQQGIPRCQLPSEQKEDDKGGPRLADNLFASGRQQRHATRL